jgi:hypothetical protein
MTETFTNFKNINVPCSDDLSLKLFEYGGKSLHEYRKRFCGTSRKNAKKEQEFGRNGMSEVGTSLHVYTTK